jgi:hypothetical protein
MPDDGTVYRLDASSMTLPRWLPREYLPGGLNLPTPCTAMLLLLFVATLVMPVNYKAGAQDEHAHTIFQGLIDAISGHAHHHASDAAEQPQPVSISPFTNPAIPLKAVIEADLAQEAAVATSPVTDEPTLLALSMPILAVAAVQSLGLLVAAALAGVAGRSLWAQRPRLTAWCRTLEPPPPRPA